MRAEVVSASLPKAAHACLTSSNGTQRVERVERSGKEAAGRAHEAGTASCCSCECGRRCGKVVVMERRLLSVERAGSQRPCGGVHGAHTAEPAPMRTLEGFALDDECCFFGCDETLLNSLIDLGNQLRVLVTATGRINAAKGMVVRVDDLVFHQDDERRLVMLLQRVAPFGHL